MHLLLRLRHAFVHRSLRERVLVLGLLATAVVIWFSSFSGRLGTTWRDAGRIAALEAEQNLLLEQREPVAARLNGFLARVEPGRTLNQTRLVAELSALLNQFQLVNNSIDTPRTEPVDQFRAHATDVVLQRADLGSLINFIDALASRAPYIQLERLDILVDPANPASMNVRLRVSAVEIPSR